MSPPGVALHQRLETLTNICILVFLVVVGGAYIKGQLSPRPSLSQIKIGDELASLPGYDWNSHPRTLVLALRYGCRYCEDSVPFYKKLADLEKTGQIKDVHVLAAFPDDSVVAQRTLQLKDLNLDFVSSVAFHEFKVSATPTAILVDRRGRVIGVWVGQLSNGEEQRILGSLGPRSNAELH